MKKRVLLTLGLLAAISITAVTVWRLSEIRAKESNEAAILTGLSAEDIRTILASQAEKPDESVSPDPQTRQVFLKALREYLSLAAAARREGLDADRAFKVNFTHKRNILVGDLYQKKLTQRNGSFYVVPPDLIQQVWAEPANERQFETDMAVMQAIQNAVARERGEDYVVSKLQGGSLTKARDNWARTKILSDMALKDTEFMDQRVVGLRIKILEAGILSSDYLRKYWSARIKANQSEIDVFLKDNPQYDVERKRKTAEEVLTKARQGADFSELAKTYSEDRSSRTNGGLYENVEAGAIWEEVERAAREAVPGTLIDRVVESSDGFHVVKVVPNKTTGQKALSIRHVLLQKKFEDTRNVIPGVPPPFLSPEEIARQAVESEKRNKFVDETIASNPVSLPEDFVTELFEGGDLRAEVTF